MPRRLTQRPLPTPAAGMFAAQRPTGIVMALVVVFVVVLAASAPTTILSLIDHNTGTLLPLALALFAVGVLVLWLWMRVKERRSFSTLGFVAGRATLTQALRGAGLGIGMMTVCVLVPVATGQATLAWNDPGPALIGMVILLLAGYAVQGSTEEIVSRGYLTQAVARRWGLVAAIIIQAVVFAALHLGNEGLSVLSIVNLLLFAVFASVLSLSEGALWGACALHAVWNWAQGGLYGVAVSGHIAQNSLFSFEAVPGSQDLLTGGAFGIEGSAVCTIVYLIGIVAFWPAFRRARLAASRPAAVAAAPAA